MVIKGGCRSACIKDNEFPPTSGRECPCRDAGVGEIAPGFAVLERAKRASHIDPPASSYAIMRRARPYRGENHGPGKDVQGELDLMPGIREQPRSFSEVDARIGEVCLAPINGLRQSGLLGPKSARAVTLAVVQTCELVHSRLRSSEVHNVACGGHTL